MKAETQEQKLKPGKNIILRKNGSKRVVTHNAMPSKTDQSFKKDCDVNHIMDKYTKTGHLTHMQQKQGMYADVSMIEDLGQAYNDVQRAEEAFESLPSKLRNKFDNDPVKFVEFMQDPKNMDEAIREHLMPDLKEEELAHAPKQKKEPEAPKKVQDEPKKITYN